MIRPRGITLKHVSSACRTIDQEQKKSCSQTDKFVDMIFSYLCTAFVCNKSIFDILVDSVDVYAGTT